MRHWIGDITDKIKHINYNNLVIQPEPIQPEKKQS